MKRALIAALVSGFVVVLAGCGEQQAVTVYKQGQYQGKPDAQPWNNAQFNDKVAWDNAVNARTQKQNEYVRIGN